MLGQRIVLSGFALIVALQRIAQVIPDGIIRSNLRQLFQLIHDFIDLNCPYRSNEILTACLNLSGKNLADYLQELNELRQKVQLEEGGGYDFCERYDRNVQRAQKLFFKVSDLIKKVPPYKNISSLRSALDGQLLWDCLNEHYLYWENGNLPGYDDPDFKDEDYCNEYGFVIKNDLGNYSFYNQRFLPDHSDLESKDADTVLMIRETNEAVCKLFDSFITLVQDLLRVQNAYSDLLDNYIHGKSKFLSDTELANCFSAYLKATERKSMTERVVSSNSMQMSHEVYCRPDGREKLCEAYTFDSLGAFLYFDFFRGLSQSYLPKRCDNCGMYFLLEGGKYSNYCERTLKDGPDKTCRDVGARKKYDDKCKSDSIWLAYNRAYKAHYARVRQSNGEHRQRKENWSWLNTSAC